MKKFTLYRAERQGNQEEKNFPHTHVITDVESLFDATRTTHMPGRCEPGTRSHETFQYADCIVGDIDNAHTEVEGEWITLPILKEAFEDYAFAVTPSRSHMKNKLDKFSRIIVARPRWHLYFPVEHHNSAEKQKEHMVRLQDKFPELHFDRAVKAAAQMIFGHDSKSKDDFYIQDGKYITAAFVGRPKGISTPHTIPWTELTMKELQANPEAVPIGGRHAAFLSLSVHWANEGDDADTIHEKLLDFNSKLNEPKNVSDPLHRKELRDIADSAFSKVQAGGGPPPTAGIPVIRNFENRKSFGKLERRPVQKVTEEMYDAMKHFVTLECMGSKSLSLKDSPRSIINSPAELRDALESIGYVWDIRSIPGAMNKDDILVSFRNRSRVIHRMSCVPEDEMLKDTLFVPEISFPEAHANGTFRQFLDIFSFKTDQDQYRFAAGILSMYLNAKWDGKIPMFALVAEAQNAGKTTVIRESIKLTTGVAALEQRTGRNNQQNNMAKFGAVYGLSAKGVLYDNLTHLSQEAEDEISQAVTDENRTAWNMGISRMDVPNSYVYFASFNDSEGFSADLQARIVVVRMRNPDEVSTFEREAIMREIEYWGDRRDEVIADIRHLISLQEIPEGCTKVATQKHASWASRIIPALKVMFPEETVFDFSMSREDHKIDPAMSTVNEFVDFLSTTDYREATQTIDKKWMLTYTLPKLFDCFVAFSPSIAKGYNYIQFGRLMTSATRSNNGVTIKKRLNQKKCTEYLIVFDEKPTGSGVNPAPPENILAGEFKKREQ